jgi:class 3 adenylate cyclase
LIAQEREQRILKDAFGAYVSGPMLQRILEAPDSHLALGGARKNLTVLFSDIQGYTGLSNQLPPEEVITLLREYLAEMTQLVCDAGGRIDKIMGDGIMAVFGDPVADPDHAGSAVKVALAMQRTMRGLREKWAGSGRAELAIRIGIATGDVFVGNIGSKRAKLEYTALGPTVNLASRLEGKAPPGGVLISKETQAACQAHFELQPVHGLTLKGYDAAYEAFLVLGPARGAEDRRRSPRVEAIGHIEVATETGAFRAEVCNVSAFGLFLAHPSPPEVGTWVKLAWRAPDLEAEVRLEGIVEHQRPYDGRAGMGIALSPAVAEQSGFQHLRSLYLRLTEAA